MEKVVKFEIKRLNLGCEWTVLAGFDNIDLVSSDPRVIKWDLNKGLPMYKDNSVDYVLFEHTIYYIKEPIDLMKEIWRVCKDRAIVDLASIHFSMGLANADMRIKSQGLSYFSFGNEHPVWNSELHGMFYVEFKKINFMRYKYTWINYIFNPLINKFPMFYERFFAYIFPSSEVLFKLRVVKDKEKIKQAIKRLTPNDEIRLRYKGLERFKAIIRK